MTHLNLICITVPFESLDNQNHTKLSPNLHHLLIFVMQIFWHDITDHGVAKVNAVANQISHSHQTDTIAVSKLKAVVNTSKM